MDERHKDKYCRKTDLKIMLRLEYRLKMSRGKKKFRDKIQDKLPHHGQTHDAAPSRKLKNI
ncbi:hypothetical protein [Christiangramia sediminis]|uniref:Uncharacterized protein n=1 Tax=Christiangramia sediminis TaxID=2881336 RepID=A0A9X1LG51_9FLAO|nr:hypothetical protein [Christiangramia sediminis]MCB7479678.1 hypothetical protein [Christiangramia sediminis]